MKLDTKKDFADYMHTILDPLKSHYSAGKARVNLGDTGVSYPPVSIEMEAFSRPLWALVPLWAGGEIDEEYADIVRRGLVAGTDPESVEYWGECGDYDQRFVEMASIACGILFAPQVIWEPLMPAEKENLATWLDGINHHFIPECNWQFFMILVNLALKKAGMHYDESNMNKGLERIESYYLADGWYQDGAAPQKDYYISWAIHYYSLVYVTAMRDEEPIRCAKFCERAVSFGKQFAYWFSDDGSALPYGRSLSYRFAQSAFWSACLFAGVEPLSVAEMKGILVRHFEYWESQTMYDRDGILTIGYAYPNLLMAERYNAPGSPYWCMKTFLLLALPNKHKFWTVKPAPLPQLTSVCTLAAADMVIHRRNADVLAYVPGTCELPGHGHTPEKYAKFAYSTAFGFSCARETLSLAASAPDSMLAFEIDGNIFVRKISRSFNIIDNCVHSVWSPFVGITVTSIITPNDSGHARHHIVESSIPCTAYDCGFAVARFRKGELVCEANNATASARNGAQSCQISGVGAKAQGGVCTADPNTNVLEQNTVIPYISYDIKVGISVLETKVSSEIF